METGEYVRSRRKRRNIFIHFIAAYMHTWIARPENSFIFLFCLFRFHSIELMAVGCWVVRGVGVNRMLNCVRSKCLACICIINGFVRMVNQCVDIRVDPKLQKSYSIIQRRMLCTHTMSISSSAFTKHSRILTIFGHSLHTLQRFNTPHSKLYNIL